ncbi:MAG: TolC family protein, partial [Snodgrassella alvi]|nr:TolC family protein [Snodgrassella alvi]
MFGRVRNSVAADAARYQQLQEDADAIRLSVASEIVRSYFDMRSAQAQLQAQESILEALRETRKIVLRRVQAGDLAQIEIQNIDTRLLSAQAAIPEIQARIRAEALALSILTGGQPNKELFLV